MKTYIGITDLDWFNLVKVQHNLEEVNFWQPGGSRQFKALDEGELFLFKLHHPRNFIVGGGLFRYSTLLPVSLSWKAFGVANGVRSLGEMRQRTLKYRSTVNDKEDFTIGCILLCEPFFLPEDLWVPIPNDWSKNIVQGKMYDLTIEPGLSLISQLQDSLASLGIAENQTPRYGKETSVRPRIGQGGFRVLVTDAYNRRCAVSGERVLPVLEAAHIKPYSAGGEHSLGNGTLLRSDLHILLDQGYVTFNTDRRFEVSLKIRDQFKNGREYYAYHGKALRDPINPDQMLATENIEWHNNNVYLG